MQYLQLSKKNRLPCDSAIPKNVVDQMNDALVQNMNLLDVQAIHIQSELMQYTAESTARQKFITQKDSAYRSISASIVHPSGFVVSRPKAAPAAAAGAELGRR